MINEFPIIFATVFQIFRAYNKTILFIFLIRNNHFSRLLLFFLTSVTAHDEFLVLIRQQVFFDFQTNDWLAQRIQVLLLLCGFVLSLLLTAFG